MAKKDQKDRQPGTRGRAMDGSSVKDIDSALKALGVLTNRDADWNHREQFSYEVDAKDNDRGAAILVGIIPLTQV